LGLAVPIQGRRVYLIDVFRKRLEFHQIEPAIVSMRMKYSATRRLNPLPREAQPIQLLFRLASGDSPAFAPQQHTVKRREA